MEIKQRLTHPTTALVFLGSLYLFSRLVNLTALPMVFDEAIYIHWAEIIRNEGLWFVSAMDGKAPFFFWLNALTLGWFDDFLVSSRILSVAAGAAAVLGVYRIGALLFSQGAGLLAALIYMSQPLVLTHDRLGLVEALFAAFVIWSVYAGLRLARDTSPAWTGAVGLGLLLGLGFLTKTPQLMFLVFPVLAMFLFNTWKDRARWLRLLLAFLIFGALALPFLLYDPPHVMPHASKVLHREVPLFDTLIAAVTGQHPRLPGHLREFAAVALLYVTEPVWILFGVGLILGLRRNPPAAGLLVLWFVIPNLAFLIYAENWFPRYFLVTLPPLALLAGVGLHFFVKTLYERFRARSAGLGWALGAALCVACLVPAWQWNVQYLAAPEKALWTPVDRWQYVRYPEGPHAVADAVRYLEQEADRQPIVVFLALRLGIPSDALYLYLRNHPNIQLYEAWNEISFPQALRQNPRFRSYPSKYHPASDAREVAVQELGERPLYFVANTRMFPPDQVLAQNPGLTLVKTYDDLGPFEIFSFALYKQPPLNRLQSTRHEGRPR